MSTKDIWSLNLGRWGRVHLRLHMSFLLFATFTCYLAWLHARFAAGPQSGSRAAMISAVGILILFASVLLHELGHFLVASRLGAPMDSLVLGPLGGLRPIRIPHDPQSELLALVAGPLTSLAVCLTGVAFVAAGGETNIMGLLHPLQPVRLFDPSNTASVLTLPTIVRLTVWINWILVLVNAIPAFPFDGGRALQALIQTIRPDVESRHAVLLAASLAKVIAAGLLVAAWFLRHSGGEETFVPTWLPLVMLSIFVFFSTRVEENQPASDEDDDELFGYDFSQGYASLEGVQHQPEPIRGPISRWIHRLKEKHEEHRRELEAQEDRHLDDILARLHNHGIESLSAAERGLLKRVSARYRSREQE